MDRASAPTVRACKGGGQHSSNGKAKRLAISTQTDAMSIPQPPFAIVKPARCSWGGRWASHDSRMRRVAPWTSHHMHVDKSSLEDMFAGHVVVAGSLDEDYSITKIDAKRFD